MNPVFGCQCALASWTIMVIIRLNENPSLFCGRRPEVLFTRGDLLPASSSIHVLVFHRPTDYRPTKPFNCFGWKTIPNKANTGSPTGIHASFRGFNMYLYDSSFVPSVRHGICGALGLTVSRFESTTIIMLCSFRTDFCRRGFAYNGRGDSKTCEVGRRASTQRHPAKVVISSPC